MRNIPLRNLKDLSSLCHYAMRENGNDVSRLLSDHPDRYISERVFYSCVESTYNTLPSLQALERDQRGRAILTNDLKKQLLTRAIRNYKDVKLPLYKYMIADMKIQVIYLQRVIRM